MARDLSCFKAYDVRGRVPDQLDEGLAYDVGRAYVECVRPDVVVVGHDVRLTSPALAGAVSRGLEDGGADVLSLGLRGTEEVYFATWHLGAGGGIMVTASHNPSDYNGLKLVREEAKPISGDSGLAEIRDLVARRDFRGPAARRGTRRSADPSDPYVEHLLSYLDSSARRPLKLVVNAGHGGAGVVIDRLEPRLPFEFVKIQHEPDGRFPDGVPNPLLPENRCATAEAVRAAGADMGIAWDGDFDRCFLFDERGTFIEGYYVVGLLAQTMLARHPGAKIIHDPRLVWNSRDLIERHGGVAVQSKTGHAFIKERMRAEDAVYGGEMSAHHYFRDFAYCDSGMIPWLLVAGILSETPQRLSELVGERIAKFPVSGEINRRLDDPTGALARVRRRYEAEALRIDETDGIGLEFADWRFNLRASNTEPVVRLNVESRADPRLVDARTAEILRMLDAVA